MINMKFLRNFYLIPARQLSRYSDWLGLDGPGIESRWGRDFAHLSRPALGPTQRPVQGYRVFSGSKERPGRNVDSSPLLVPWSRKSRAIPLLPLWAVQPVQNHSTCTRVHFTLPFI